MGLEEEGECERGVPLGVRYVVFCSWRPAMIGLNLVVEEVYFKSSRVPLVYSVV